MRYLAVACVSTIVAVVLSAHQDNSNAPRDGLPQQMNTKRIPAGLAQDRPVPRNNPLTQERVELGRRLFFDTILSKDRTVSCATCHDPKHGFASKDPLAIGIGGQKGRRNSPTLFNVAYGTIFFWDGRAGTLEEQARQPIINPFELGSTHEEVVQRLQADEGYVRDFRKAFGQDRITIDLVTQAIASFERTLLSGNSKVDRFHASDATALNTEERQGLWLFESRGRCWKCHSGPTLSDNKFHNTGVSWGKEPYDLGRYEVTKQERDRGAFKTPTLRDVSRTAPYMHDGSMATLEEVVQFYNRGGQANPYLDKDIQPLNLTEQEVGFLVAFLRALDGSGD